MTLYHSLTAAERAALPVGTVLRMPGWPDLDLVLSARGWLKRGANPWSGVVQTDVGLMRVVLVGGAA